MTIQREGFWKEDKESQLPIPRAAEKPWNGKKEFLKALKKVEAVSKGNVYKGYSTCRCCGERNGNGEYRKDTWLWPEGFLHYIQQHNVRPSLAFQEFILGKRVE